MSILTVKARPLTVFDVLNRKHRALYAEFVQTKSWKHSPLRFIASEPTECDIGTISRQVTEFYVEKEFAKNG